MSEMPKQQTHRKERKANPLSSTLKNSCNNHCRSTSTTGKSCSYSQTIKFILHIHSKWRMHKYKKRRHLKSNIYYSRLHDGVNKLQCSTDDILIPRPKIWVKFENIDAGGNKREEILTFKQWHMLQLKEVKVRLIIPAPRSQTRILRCEQDKTCTNSAKRKSLK